MINKRFKNFYTAGTSLVELMVVIFIFTIITGVTIFNYGKFNSSISIQNLADDIALSIRRAQGYAIGVRGYGSSFSGGYGVHFSPKMLVSGQEYKGSNKSFVLFTDLGLTQNKKYDYPSSFSGCGTPVSGNECIEILNILGTDAISAIIVSEGSTSTPVPVDGSVEILFYRPNPEPFFCYRSNVAYSSCDLSTSITSVKIEILNTRNGETTTKSVVVSNNGQISVSSSGD